MALQADRLRMIGLGVESDLPPIAMQPPLRDGVHLRWGFPREVGFPWYGYYLFRRLHESRTGRCVAPSLAGRELGDTGVRRLITREGSFSSRQLITLSNDFPGTDLPEVDVDRQFVLNFDMPIGDPAFRVDLRIGLRSKGPIFVTAVDGATPVGWARVDGTADQVISVSLEAGRITRVRIDASGASSGSVTLIPDHPGAVVDLCWFPLIDRASHGWQPLADCPQPITLPLTHPDYPAQPGPVNLGSDEQDALNRIVYGDPAPFAGADFASLHDQLQALVVGGPHGTRMDDATRALINVIGTPVTPGADGQPPHIPMLHPLHLVLLGAMHAPIAQMLGLYWLDATAVAGTGYDYLIVADRANVAHGDVAEMRAQIELLGLDNVDGIDAWILMNQRRGPAAPLSPPTDVRAYALPGGTYRASGAPATNVATAAGNAGVMWRTGVVAPGSPVSIRAVMHHVWRSRQGNGQAPAASPEATELATAGAPLLMSHPVDPPDEPTRYPSDWPPFSLRFIDFSLDEGWYGYQVNGIDLFGRFSPKSSFAQWRQWAPAPSPKPWYFVDPPGDGVIHPVSVRILDKSSPPSPMAVAAYALDPADPLVVKDQAHDLWRHSLSAASRDTLVGLRVQWRWSVAQQRQAPDTVEFRVYWNAGSALPNGWEDVAVWPLRCYVCPYAANVTVGADGDRSYDVFLPVTDGSGPFGTGIPLDPTLALPLLYANVTVTAADGTSHATDRWPGPGPLAGRAGNESRAAAPSRVYRVRRQKPGAPEAVVDSDRVYASPADWHGRAYHSFRWRPVANLQTHVLRAMDESVFATHWRLANKPTVTPDSAQYFPAQAVEPTWTAAKRQLVAAALTALSAAPDQAAALKLYRALSDDALRVLANLPGCETAFTQLSISPLDPDDPANFDQRGPDDAAGYTPRADVRAYLDTLDGRATNRYLYRAIYVDGANNRSVPGPCGPPVRLPNVVPPRPPTVTKVTAGERQITLAWASNREPDLTAYRVYRADSAEAARDLRLMTLVATLAAEPDPAARPGAVEWTDDPVRGLVDFWYRVTALDQPDPVDPRGGGGNESEPSQAIRSRSYDLTPPEPPQLDTIEWVRVDETGGVHAWSDAVPASSAWRPAVRLAWATAAPDLKFLVQVKTDSDSGFTAASNWLAPGTTTFLHRVTTTFEGREYRLKVVNGAGNANTLYNTSTLAPPN